MACHILSHAAVHVTSAGFALPGLVVRRAREAARRPRGIQQLEGGEWVLFCPECGFGPQQKAKVGSWGVDKQFVPACL